MSRLTLPSVALATLVLAGCAGGGHHYWLYPGPRLQEVEEAIFLAYESHGLQAIDDEDVGSMCWDDMRRPQAYSRADVACRLHIRPGEHSVLVRPSPANRGTVALTFTAEPGKVYGVDRSACSTSSFSREARQQTCQVTIMEVG